MTIDKEKTFIRKQIERLKKRKESLIDEFIGACTEINNEIKEFKRQLKEQNE